MSSSTVAVTANPTANNSPVLALGARRRNVSVSEKKTSNIEMVSSEGGGTGEQVSSETKTGTAMDLTTLQVKKSLISSTTVSPRPPRRKSTSVPKTTQERPRWQTVASVFTKNFVLLIVLLGLVQLISKLMNPGYKDGVLPTHRVSEIEGRIGDIDSLLKKTSKMMQVQFEVVDKKIENEVSGVRRDLVKKIEEKGAMFENGLKKLEGRTDGLQKSLSELESYKFLTKEDLERFSDELKNSRGGERTDEPVSLDEIRGIARDIVLKEIDKHAADGLGRVDYALASAGAVVVAHSESLFPTITTWLKTRRINSVAQKMLQPSFGEPGQCFPIKGSNGFVEVRLRTAILPDAVTLEHVAKSVAYDRSSAPKDCKISGWYRARDADQSSQVEEKNMLAEFTYDLESSNVQTFGVDSTNAGLVNMIRLDFTSNHGGPHTCIYRLRVHGHEPESDAVSTLQA